MESCPTGRLSQSTVAILATILVTGAVLAYGFYSGMAALGAGITGMGGKHQAGAHAHRTGMGFLGLGMSAAGFFLRPLRAMRTI